MSIVDKVIVAMETGDTLKNMHVVLDCTVQDMEEQIRKVHFEKEEGSSLYTMTDDPWTMAGISLTENRLLAIAKETLGKEPLTQLFLGNCTWEWKESDQERYLSRMRTLFDNITQAQTPFIFYGAAPALPELCAVKSYK
ncbi:hypothetical protein GOV10_03700 [Candidatus Woesearchaeota archaeon]|nr:hypothetical protein [Candidatus Woesearchaeota archaeon]